MATFMEGLDAVQAAALRELGTVRRFPRGAALFHERQAFDRALILLRGRVKVTCTTGDGREVVLAVRDAGDLLGEMSAIDGEPRSATAVALEPVEVLAVPAAGFLTFLERNPRVMLELMRGLVRRLRDADSKRVEFAAQDTVGRVAARLVELAQRYGQERTSTIQIDLPLSQEELAGWTGCSREAVTKALHAMRELGWIETGRRTVTVLDPEALRRRSGG